MALGDADRARSENTIGNLGRCPRCRRRKGPLPTDGTISALNIPHSSIVFDMYDEVEITAELLGGDGVVTERIKHASIVSFTCLKVFAFNDRLERKDAHDLIYCIEYAPKGLDAVAENVRAARAGKHGAVIERALESLRRHFATDAATAGYVKDGPVAVAKFELGVSDEAGLAERRALRQREASDLVERLLARIG